MSAATDQILRRDGFQEPLFELSRFDGLAKTLQPPVLVCSSRKRGILESDLLLSSFAAEHLDRMTPAQLEQYDRFLDENDWDIYYWLTQTGDEPTSGSAGPVHQQTDGQVDEWAQTIGRFRPAYRPVPDRWQKTDIFDMLRRHVASRRAGPGQVEAVKETVDARGPRGFGFMPDLPDRRQGESE